MKRLKWLLGGVVDVGIFFIVCLPGLGIIAVVLGMCQLDPQKQVKWQQHETQDRADFERIFQVPASVPRTSQTDFTNAEYQAAQIRGVKVAHILLGEAQQILSLEQEIHRLEHTDTGSSYQEQMAQAASSKKQLHEAITKFAADVRLAQRFDYTGLYDDIDEQFELRHGMNGAFCFIVDRLKNQDFSGFPFSGNISSPPGCSE